VDAQLLIVGDGRQRAAVERLCASLGIAGQTRFTGYVPVAGDLPGLYRLASVFVTASEVEIQSSVVMEAAAAGLPVVAVRASSMPEFVEDGRNGYLVPPRDVDALGERLAFLVDNPDHARALGRAGRALAEAHSPERTLEAHERVYRELV
jgi:glycosyltransferase involved in cell wall biosynthesis